MVFFILLSYSTIIGMCVKKNSLMKGKIACLMIVCLAAAWFSMVLFDFLCCNDCCARL